MRQLKSISRFNFLKQWDTQDSLVYSPLTNQGRGTTSDVRGTRTSAEEGDQAETTYSVEEQISFSETIVIMATAKIGTTTMAAEITGTMETTHRGTTSNRLSMALQITQGVNGTDLISSRWSWTPIPTL